MQIEDLLLDSSGALWIGTRGGLARFNGSSFDSFEDIGSRPPNAYELQEDSQGNIVVLSSKGIYFFDGKTFVLYPAPPDASFNYHSKMIITGDDEIWTYTSTGGEAQIFKDSSYYNVEDTYPELVSDKIGNLEAHYGSESILIFIIGQGVFSLKNDQLKPILECTEGVVFINSHLKGSIENELFLQKVIEKESEFFHLDNNLELQYKFKELDGRIIEMSSSLDKGIVSISRLSNHLFEIPANSSTSQIMIPNTASKFNYPGNCFFDDQQNIYLETDKGLVVINGNRFIKYSEDLLPNVWSIVEDPKNNIIVGGYGTGVKRLHQDGTVSDIQVKDKIFCTNKSLSLQASRVYMGAQVGLDGHPIIPCEGGLLKLVGDELTLFDHIESCTGTLASLFVYVDHDNQRILSATCQGLRILDSKGNLLRIVKEGLFKHRCLLTINKDKLDNYWIGATGGVAKYDYANNSITNYTLENGKLPFAGVICSFSDHRDNLWVGSKSGLAYYDQKSDLFISVPDFENNSIHAAINGEESTIFLKTKQGIAQCDFSTFYEEGKILHRIYDKTSGYTGLGGGQNGFFKSSTGEIWITSETEVNKFKPESLKPNTAAVSSVHITKINNERIVRSSTTDPVSLPKDINDLNIEFESLGLAVPNNIDYSYLLEGHEEDWSTPSKYQSVSFNNLGSGTYTFKLKSNRSEEIAEQEIEIDLALYNEPHFGKIAGLGSLSLLFLSLLYRRNYRLSKRNNALLKDQELHLEREKVNIEKLHRLEKENSELLRLQNESLLHEKEELEIINKKLKKDIIKIKKQRSLTQDQKLDIKVSGKIHKVPERELLYVYAEDNGCRFHFTNGQSLWNDNKLKSWEEILDPFRFVRIHRSTIVQKEYIEQVSYDHVTLLAGIELKVGRRYKENLQ